MNIDEAESALNSGSAAWDLDLNQINIFFQSIVVNSEMNLFYNRANKMSLSRNF